MANVVPYSFGTELFSGTHNFSSGGNTFKLALYTANPYTTASTAYSSGAANQVSASGTNYTTGGNTLTSQAVSNQNNVATVDFADTSWSSATFTAAFGVIYNNTQSDKLVVVLDFGGSKSASNGTFTISFPDPTSGSPAGSDAIISLTS
jgi:hypothetical protein|tara:strand:- start:142 stop:588 length:447 start_codon:yes stop_codon:yes gene_type:complete